LIASSIVFLTLGIAGAFVAPSSPAQASMQMDGLSIADENKTVSGNVTAVTLDADLSYQHEVPDAERRIVKLKVGPSKDDLTLVDYQQQRDPSGTASGTVTLSGSVLEHEAFSAEVFQPGVASTSAREIVVQAVVEVQRSGGDAVTHTVTDTATVRLTDDAELSAAVGGTGVVSVETDA
jgi:hypothetical protein